MIKKIILFIFIVIGVFLTKYTYADTQADCSSGSQDKTQCITLPEFEINIGSLTPSGNNNIKDSGEATTNALLLKFIENLMIAIGVIALFIMTAGGGFMIIYVGQDELLSKGKSMFSAGAISLAVALSSGIIIKLVSYLLYK